MPSYLFKRNFIGPTSCLIIRNSSANYLFDINLNWFVDVDFYYRLLTSKKSNYEFSNTAYILSYQDNTQSITNSFKSNLKQIIKNEHLYLKLKYPTLNFSKFKFFENIFWYSYKLIFYPFSFYLNFKINKK
jgi:hypothetical protein